MKRGKLASMPVRRALESRVRAALADTPIVVIQGARQVGKSTLAGLIGASIGAVHVTLDDAAALASARFDPAAFAGQAGAACLVIDEVQRAQELVLAVKAAVDRDRRPGRFLLTGSADLLRLGGDTLAGRAETLELWGFAQTELRGASRNPVDRLFSGELGFAGPGVGRRALLELVCAGSYPEVLARPTADRRAAWFASYVDRIAERDVHELSGLRFASLVPDILRVAGAHTAGVVSRATLARDIGMAEPTLPPYLELLESLRLIVRLPNWAGTAVSRARSRPKLLLADSGLAAWLAHASPATLAPSGDPDRAGRLVETFAICEILKGAGWSATPVRAYHWRDRREREVDLVLEAHDGRVVAVEVKASSSVGAGDFAGLRAFAHVAGERFAAGVVLHLGDHAVPFGDRMAALPLDALWS